MSKMFNRASSFNQPLENWNVSNVKNMSLMFAYASSFNQPLGKWNVSNVTTMYGMFSGASSFNQPLDKWDLSNTCTVVYMFYEAESFNHYPKSWIIPEGDEDPNFGSDPLGPLMPGSYGMFSGTKLADIFDKKPLKTHPVESDSCHY